MRWARAFALLAVVAALVSAASASSQPSSHLQVNFPASNYAVPVGIHKIKHVVIIMQENRSFDNYFGTFPGAAGIPLHNGQPSVCLPAPKIHRCVKPFHDRRDVNYGGPHDSNASAADINGGKMDGFLAQQEAAVAKCGCGTPNPPNDAVGYHTGKEIPNYWTYARDFVLQDHMFQSEASWSLPSHLYLVSLWSAHCTKKNDPHSCVNSVQSPGNPPHWGHNPSSKPPIYAWTDLTYLLYKHHVSWRYYIFRGIEPDCETNASVRCVPRTQGPLTSPVWNPLRWFDDVRADHQLGNIQSINGFFSAMRRGTLPAVSWVMPNQQVSEHPFSSTISKGQTYVTGVINALMQSPDWKSTAIFVAWDDWGGFYDHLKPPRVDKNGYGLQVPAFMISPYARHGYIDHHVLSFDAYAKFIEDDFLSSQRLNPNTDGRPDPRPDVRENAPQLGNLLGEFNFSQAPRPPVMLPVHPKTDLIP